MKFVYVLVSGISDVYYEQFLVSLISLRHWNPDAKISLVCDDETGKSMTGLRARHTELIDEIKIIPFEPSFGKHYRSRFLKTTLREIFEGDFLYLDCDTIVCEKIEESNFKNDIMGVDDCHQKPQENSNWPVFLTQINQSGFSEAGLIHYINGGVLWMRDSDIAHKFSSLWHTLWLQSVEKNIPVDMPSLNETNKRMNGIVGILPGVYNCQVSASLKYLHTAKIIHCFATAVSNSEMPESAFYFLNSDFYYKIKTQHLTSNDKELIFDAKSAFDGRETILLGKYDSDVYRNLSRTNLYGFIRCLFLSKRGRWLFTLMDRATKIATSIFWGK